MPSKNAPTIIFNFYDAFPFDSDTDVEGFEAVSAGAVVGAAGPSSGSGFADSYSRDLINLYRSTANSAPTIGPTQ